MSRLFVITGNSRGLGRALSRELERRGQRVAGFSRSQGVDVADPEQVEAWARQLVEREGPPDVLINNAAVTTRPDPLWLQDPAEIARLLMVNVAGVQHVLRAFVPVMNQGVIVNVSSDWGRTSAPLVGPYCASKAAVEALTASLAEELPAGFAAVSLDPGTYDTDMLRFTFLDGAGAYPPAEAFAAPAAELIMSLGPSDNGRQLTLSLP